MGAGVSDDDISKVRTGKTKAPARANVILSQRCAAVGFLFKAPWTGSAAGPLGPALLMPGG